MRWNRASCCKYDGKSMETETKTRSEFSNGEKDIVEQILTSEEINKSKIAGLWDLKSGIRVGKLTVWLRSFEIENYNRVHQIYQCHQNRQGSPYDRHDGQVSKDIPISRRVDRENLINVKDQNPRSKAKKEIDRGNRSKTLSVVKPVKNISKNL